MAVFNTAQLQSEPTFDLKALSIARPVNEALLNDTLQTVGLTTALGEQMLSVRAAGLIQVSNKSDGTKVTNVDVEASDLLIKELGGREGVRVYSEETITSVNRKTPEPDWYLIDPIDGTSTYVGGYPDFCICVARMHHDRPVSAVIAIPAHAEVFFAVAGAGAFKLSTADSSALPERIAAQPQPSEVFRFGGFFHPRPGEAEKLDTLFAKSGYSNVERVKLSAATKYCRVADGSVEAAGGFATLSPWDVAAADLIVQEAGGSVTDEHGQPISYNAENRPISAFAMGQGVKFNFPTQH